MLLQYGVMVVEWGDYCAGVQVLETMYFQTRMLYSYPLGFVLLWSKARRWSKLTKNDSVKKEKGRQRDEIGRNGPSQSYKHEQQNKENTTQPQIHKPQIHKPQTINITKAS